MDDFKLSTDNGNQFFYTPAINNAPIQVPATVPDKPKFKVNKKDIIFLIVFCVLAFLMVDFVLLHGFNLGATISFFVLFSVTSIYLFKKDNKLSAFPIICGVLSLAGAVTFTLFNDTFIKVIMLFLVSSLFTVYTCGISSTFRNKTGSYKMLFDMICGVLAAPFKNISIIKNSYSSSFSKSKGIKSSLIGIAVSVPVLVVIIPLLSSSDAAFSGLVMLIIKNIGIYLLEFILAVIIAPYLICYMVSKRKNLATGSENADKAFCSRGFIPSSAVVSFLSVISVTYVVYMFSQLAYFFSAFSGILPQDYKFTESAYARRGFFEMFAICVINILIISLVNILIKKQKGAKSFGLVKALSVFIMLFSVLMLVTVIAKMKLCLSIFGLSKNRLLVCTFMIMLFVIIFFYIVHIFVPKMSYMQPIIVFCSVLFIALSYADVDAMIVKYNVEAFNSGKIESLDVDYIGSLSDEAMPYIIELASSQNSNVSRQAGYYIAEEIRDKYYDEFSSAYNKCEYSVIEYNGADDFRSYNRSKDNASKALVEYYNSLTNEQKEMLFINYRFDSGDYWYDEERDVYESYSDNDTFVYRFSSDTGNYEFSSRESNDVSVGEELL